MDVLAGITPPAEAGKADPVIKTYISAYPFEPDRCVVVTTFGNYLSPAFLRKIRKGTNDATYKLLKPGAYLRVASHIDDAQKELARQQCELGSCELKVCPGVVFGQFINSLKVHEATPDIAEHETDILDMTNFFCHRVVDAVFGECLDLLRAQLISNGAVSRDYSFDDEQEAGTAIKGLKTFPYSKKFPMPIGLEVPVGKSKDLVNLCSGNKTYGWHSDTYNKHDTHDNDFAGNQALFTSILTHGGVFTPNNEPCPKGPIVSLQHGLQEGRQKELSYCRVLGIFDSETGVYQRVGKVQAILLLGKSHAHLQFLGTQGGLIHEIQSIKNSNIVCSIFLPRSLFILTPKCMMEKYGKILAVDTANNQHC